MEHGFLGAFAKLQKATISFAVSVVMRVCPSVRKNSAPNGRIFMQLDMYFSKICLENSSLIKIWQE